MSISEKLGRLRPAVGNDSWRRGFYWGLGVTAASDLLLWQFGFLLTLGVICSAGFALLMVGSLRGN